MEVDDSTVVPASVPPAVKAPAAPVPRSPPIIRRPEKDDENISFRQRYESDLTALKERYLTLEPEFDDDDMNATLTEAERKRGWKYPMTKTQQKKEYGCVVAEQQRFLWRLQDGHLDIVEDYILNAKMKKTIDVNLYDEQGWTPLHYAAHRNYADIVKVLLNGNANANLKDKVCGMTAFDMASMGIDDETGPSEEVLEVLKAYGIKK